MKLGLLLISTSVLVTMLMKADEKAINYDNTTEFSASTYTYVEMMPHIIGGISNLYEKIEEEASGVSEKIECNVFLEFTVTPSGEAVNPSSLTSTSTACSLAAISGLKEVNFTPGYKNGEAVTVLTTLPLRFYVII